MFYVLLTVNWRIEMSNVLTMEKKENKTASEKIESFLTSNRVPILCAFLAVIVAAVVVCVISVVKQNGYKKGIAAIDSIEYTFTKDINSDDASDLVSRQSKAMEELKPYLEAKNIVGVRANMLAAEIAYEKKDFSSSLSYWLTAAGIQKNSYLNPVCYFNAASCSEELNNDSDAATYYEMAANSKEFLLATRAMFNLARVKESLGDNAGAAEVYKNLVEGHPYDTWANLAQSRLIALKADGFIE